MTGSPTPACPRCGNHSVTRGYFIQRATCFTPEGLRFFTLQPPYVPFIAKNLKQGQAFGCLACGLVWNEIDPVALRQILAQAGTEATQQQLSRSIFPESSQTE